MFFNVLVQFLGHPLTLPASVVLLQIWMTSIFAINAIFIYCYLK